MSKTFEERVDSTAEFLNEYFNHQDDQEPMTKGEAREILTTILGFVKDDFDGN